MKPKILKETVSSNGNIEKGNLAKFSNTTGNELEDSQIKAEDLIGLVERLDAIYTHLTDKASHITDKERLAWNRRESITDHTGNEDIHVSAIDRENWDEKETPEGAQAKADKVMEALNKHAYDSSCHVTAYEKNRIKDVYTKIEIDQLFDQLNTNTMWKEAVNTYEDLFTTYPDPIDGWTVNVLDSDLTYKFDGIDWICISANFIPIATELVDGKMSKEDKYKLNTIEEGANNYIHPNDSYTRHVTDVQIAIWSEKADNVLATKDNDGLMTAIDYSKLQNIEENANFYTHPSTHSARIIDQTDDLQFVSAAEKEAWSAKAEKTMATEYVDGLFAKEDFKKLRGIAENANMYVHPISHEASIINETNDKQFVSTQNKTTWNAKYGRGDFIKGNAVFNGTSGIRINHDLNDMNKLYSVMITVTSCNTPSKLGIVWVEKQPAYIIVYSSGGNIADSFDYLIIKN